MLQGAAFEGYPVTVSAGAAVAESTVVSITGWSEELLLELPVQEPVELVAELFDVQGNPSGSAAGNPAEVQLVVYDGDTLLVGATTNFVWSSEAPYNRFQATFSPSVVTRELSLVVYVDAEVAWEQPAAVQVRLRRHRFSPTGDLGYRGLGARKGYRIQVHCISGPCHPPQYK